MSAAAKISLSFGAAWLVPNNAPAAWGARWIFPADMVWDRQGWHNPDSAEGAALRLWLNSKIKRGDSPLQRAGKEARKLAAKFRMSQDGSDVHTLYEDEVGVIKGTPNRSYGYVYVAAWMKEGL